MDRPRNGAGAMRCPQSSRIFRVSEPRYPTCTSTRSDFLGKPVSGAIREFQFRLSTDLPGCVERSHPRGRPRRNAWGSINCCPMPRGRLLASGSDIDRDAGGIMQHPAISLIVGLALGVSFAGRVAAEDNQIPQQAERRRAVPARCQGLGWRTSRLCNPCTARDLRLPLGAIGRKLRRNSGREWNLQFLRRRRRPVSRGRRVQRRVHLLRHARSCDRRQGRQAGIRRGRRTGRLDLRQELRGRRPGRAIRRPSGPRRLVHEPPRRVSMEEHGEFRRAIGASSATPRCRSPASTPASDWPCRSTMGRPSRSQDRFFSRCNPFRAMSTARAISPSATARCWSPTSMASILKTHPLLRATPISILSSRTNYRRAPAMAAYAQISTAWGVARAKYLEVIDAAPDDPADRQGFPQI